MQQHSPRPDPERWTDSPTTAAFRDTVQRMPDGARAAIVAQAARLLSGFYAHLPAKCALHGIHPLGRLAALGDRPDTPTDDLGFHRALGGILDELRDLHTGYVWPPPFAGMVAFLPFQVRACWERGTSGERRGPRYIVVRVLDGFDQEEFGPGAEIITWNGVPIARAVARLAERSAGGNAAAAHARAVATLSQRPLLRLAPPDEDWVQVGFTPSGGGAEREVRAVWRVCAAGTDAHDLPSQSHPGLSLDFEGDALLRLHKRLFAPHVRRDEHAARSRRAYPARRHSRHPLDVEIPSRLPGLIRAWHGRAHRREFGHLRVFSFHTEDAEGFLAEIRRLLALLPPDGLLLDVRDNSGGLVEAAERMLQYFTDRRITPAAMQMLATPETLALCEALDGTRVAGGPNLSAWAPSLRQALRQGDHHSAALPMTSRDACNDTGQLYRGRVILLTSALSYSATDIFAAGFADHQIGPVHGVDDQTGGGGANMWQQAQLAAVGAAGIMPMPEGAGMRVAIRRVLRGGAFAGQLLEESGVASDVVCRPTRTDLLERGKELIAAAAAHL